MTIAASTATKRSSSRTLRRLADWRTKKENCAVNDFIHGHRGDLDTRP